jgi:hypothetical protein
MPRSRRPQTLTPPPFTGSADNFVTKDGVLGAQSTSSVQRDGVRNHAVLVLQRDCTEHRLTGAVHIAGRAASLPVANNSVGKWLEMLRRSRVTLGDTMSN